MGDKYKKGVSLLCKAHNPTKNLYGLYGMDAIYGRGEDVILYDMLGFLDVILYDIGYLCVNM